MIGVMLAIALAAAPVDEARAVALQKALRCVVCQNESINDSAAPLAADMRAVLRERMEAGDTDAEIKAYFVKRYGDFVLMRPPLKVSTIALWVSPALFLGIGAVMFIVFLRRRPPFDDDLPSDEAGA
jgi:cytochrome c-type biogenesis protein CcmH